MGDQILTYQFIVMNNHQFTTSARSLGDAVVQLGEWMRERGLDTRDSVSPYLRQQEIRITTFP